MDSIRVDAGLKRIAINDDETRVISFNPTDVEFAERFYALLQRIEIKQTEYQERAEALDLASEVDENGIPVNTPAGLAFLRDACTDLHNEIDTLFGPGTSQTVFNGSMSLDMVTQFFEGLLPFFQSVRDERVAKYRLPEGRKSRKTMK